MAAAGAGNFQSGWRRGADGEPYRREDFLQYYGPAQGHLWWDMALHVMPAWDGRWYTRAEFMTYYGIRGEGYWDESVAWQRQ